jgi:hypothetical protein
MLILSKYDYYTPATYHFSIKKIKKLNFFFKKENGCLDVAATSWGGGWPPPPWWQPPPNTILFFFVFFFFKKKLLLLFFIFQLKNDT